jgi:hypothetical protein
MWHFTSIPLYFSYSVFTNFHENPRNELKVSIVIVWVKTLCSLVSDVQSAGWLNIQFTVGTSCERAAPLAEKNAVARHHVMRSLISLHNEHSVCGHKSGDTWCLRLHFYPEGRTLRPWKYQISCDSRVTRDDAQRSEPYYPYKILDVVTCFKLQSLGRPEHTLWRTFLTDLPSMNSEILAIIW